MATNECGRTNQSPKSNSEIKRNPRKPSDLRNKKSNEERCSRALSWALRHAAPELGLTMTSDGYVPILEILQHKHARLKGLDLEGIRAMVESNEKRRFSIKEDEYGVTYIRANQGHSISGIDPEALLTRIKPEELATLTIVHGTYQEPWEKHIFSQGLSRMKRNHIHFASGLPKYDNSVISGMRKTCTIYIYLDGEKCSKDRIAFFRSDNGVILTAGVNDEGILPIKYFSHVISSTGEILFENQVAPKKV